MNKGSKCALLISHIIIIKYRDNIIEGAQSLSDGALDSRSRGRGFEPHRRHCIVVLEQDTFILA